MTFAVVDVEGCLTISGRHPTKHQLMTEMMGPHHRTLRRLARVNLRVQDENGMSAFKSGWRRDDRNLLGSLLLALLGAERDIHCGPLVITGWDRPVEKIKPLPLRWRVMVQDMHASMLSVLAGGATNYGPQWDEHVRRLAAILYAAPPEPETLPVEDHFGRDRTPVRWWRCPNRGESGSGDCGHGGIWHDIVYPYRCGMGGCECAAF